MIRWQSDFNIPDSTVQLAVTVIRVDSFRQIGNDTMIEVRMTDETGEILVKGYEQLLTGAYQDLASIYEAISPEFSPSELIPDV